MFNNIFINIPSTIKKSTKQNTFCFYTYIRHNNVFEDAKHV